MSRQVASLHGVLSLKDESFKQGLRDAKSGMGDVAGRLQSFGGQVAGLGAKISLMTAPLAAFGIAGVRVASTFEESMAEISARTGIVGDDLLKIRDFALKMGADTSFSAQQAADAFLQLLTSGASAEQAMAMLPAILDAAAASGEELGTTADTITDIMAAFGVSTEYAADVVDVLARAAGASSADMASLGQGFANVGGVAKQFGLSVNDTAAVLAIFSENGVKGAEAGTQLKSMLLNMVRPTEDVQGAWKRLGTSMYDANGNARPLKDVIKDLDAALDALPIEEQNELMTTLAGSYGIVGLMALRGSISISDMQTSMAGSASASEVADARMNTFAGAVDSLKGSVETLMITALTPLMTDVLQPLVESLTPVINSVTEWATKNPELAGTIAAISAALVVLGPVLMGVSAAIGVLGGAIAFVTSPIGLLIGAVVALGVLIAATWEDTIKPALEALYNWFVNDAMPAIVSFIETTVMPVVEGFINILKGIWETIQPGLQAVYDWFVANGLPVIQGAIDVVVGVLNSFIDGLKFIWDTVSPGLNALKDGLNTVFGWIKTNIIDPIGSAFQDLFEWINDVLAKLGLVQTEARNTQQIASDAVSANGSGISYGGVTAPGKAAGGPVDAGSAYTVGEFGPELFIPATSGQIVPNEAMGGTTIQMGQIVIYANSRAEGEAAADAFGKRLAMLLNEAG